MLNKIIPGLVILFIGKQSLAQQTDSVNYSIKPFQPVFKNEWLQATAVPLLLFGGSAATWGERKAVRELRNRYIPSFRHHYDDYLQYAPAVTVIGLNMAGVKGKNHPTRTLVSYAFSAAIMGLVVNSIKYTAKVERPDGSSNNSFPSGHTANSFMNATLLHKEYGQYRHPIYSVAAYSLATATAVGRQLNNRHWISDVLAGAGIGLISTQLGYLIADKIYKDRQLNPPLNQFRLPSTQKPSFLEMKIGYSRLLDNDLVSIGRLSARNGFQFGLQGAYFFTRHIGIGAEFGFSSFPVNQDAFSLNEPEVNEISNGYYVQPIGIRFIQAGPFLSFPLNNNWFITGKFTAGISHAAQGDIRLSLKEEYQNVFTNMELSFVKYKPGNAPSFSTGLGLRKRLGRNMALTAYADYFYSRHEMEIDGISAIQTNGTVVYTPLADEKIRYSNLGIGLGLTAFLW